MKKIVLTFIIPLIVNISFGQQIENLEYCNCQDRIGQINPSLNGLFVRSCNDELIEKGEFINGLKNGEWITYSKNGTLIRRINYENGLLHGKVELFYVNGNPKLTAEFKNGNKISRWTYYTDKGKILMEGNYILNKPTGNWTIYNKKGKKIVLQYDYKTNKYLINNTAQLHKDGDIIQNENTEEWYILKYPQRNNTTSTHPLGGFLFASDIFVETVEVPLDYWDTYINYKYKATFNISTDNSSIFDVMTINNHMSDSKPIFPFLIITNPDSKIKRIEHSDLSIKLLEYKITEALNLLPPWIYKESTKEEVYIPYVINKIIKN
ncbi:toxin-antitoxin system YwqK family antitoxin [Bacteroidota bacterium]